MTLDGTGASVEHVDDTIGDVPQYFWRVLADNGAFSNVEPLFAIVRLEKVDGSGNVIPSGSPGAWKITWRSVEGALYRLDRSDNMGTWGDVLTKTGLEDETSAIDSEATGPKNFWRVVRLDAGGVPLVISEVMVGYQLDGTTSSALFRILAGGSETVQSVVFYDQGVSLGNAQPGFGNTWSFSIDWDEANPEPKAIDAEVMTEEGTSARTLVERFLLADPTKYIPLDAEGKPLYGEFVPVDENGELGAFLFLS